MGLDINLELRKLSPGNLFSLVQILEHDESWKQLMAIIPKILTLENYESKIAINNLPKYNTEHFKLIENAGYKQRKPCCEILFEEWGTSGRIRPRLGHLLHLLQRANLYRAVEYVASLLEIPPPERPTTGPAAKVDTTLDSLKDNSPINSNDAVQRILDEINYPSSLLNTLMVNNNIDRPSEPPKLIIPKIVVNDMSSSNIDNVGITGYNDITNNNSSNSNNETVNRSFNSRSNNESNNTRSVNSHKPNNAGSDVSSEASLIWREFQLEKKIEKLIISPPIQENVTESTDIESGSHKSDSDMIRFSSDSDGIMPAITSLLNENIVSNEDNQIHETFNYDIPQLSDLMQRSQNISDSEYISDSNINQKNHSTELPAFSKIISSEYDVPAFSQILQSSNSESGFIPQITQLLSNSQITNENAQNDLENTHVLRNELQNGNMVSNVSLSNGNSEFIPNLSALNPASVTTRKNSTGSISLNDDNPIIPNLSALNPGSDPNFNTVYPSSEISRKGSLSPANSLTLSNESTFLPNLSALNPTSEVSRKNSLSPVSTSRTTCASPLPNLSLNTVLPHFTYIELDQCTNGFDETELTTHLTSYNNEPNGRKLGSGAFGSVYLATGLLEVPVAVKKLNLNGVNVVNVDDTITKQFRNEVELLCKYKHENLLSLLGYSCDGPTYCLIYEYICGGALKDRLQSAENRLVWTDRLYIALGTARAVSYLHTAYSMPLIHRDIKSANILLDNANKPKLCDFGLIKLTPNQNTNTSTTVFGTSAYMAPEAFRGDVSVKLDTFSFGVVLLELLTGLPPLDENRQGHDLVTHVEDVCEEDIKPLLDTRAGTWTLRNVHFGEQLYSVATQCLEEKKRRLTMPDVVKQLSALIYKANNAQ